MKATYALNERYLNLTVSLLPLPRGGLRWGWFLEYFVVASFMRLFAGSSINRATTKAEVRIPPAPFTRGSNLLRHFAGPLLGKEGKEKASS
jgi:hypothetical protein